MNRSRLCGQHKKPRKTGLRRPRKSGHPPQAHTAIHLAKQKGQDFPTVGCPDFSFVLVMQRRLRPAFTAAAAMAGQLVDFLFGAAEGDAQIAQVRFRGLGHFAGEFLVGLAALGQIGEVHHRQVLEFRLVQLFPDRPQLLRGAFQDRHGEHDDPPVQPAALVGHVRAYGLRHLPAQGDAHDRRRICGQAHRQRLVQHHHTLFMLLFHLLHAPSLVWIPRETAPPGSGPFRPPSSR